jgi:hypothetical protein
MPINTAARCSDLFALSEELRATILQALETKIAERGVGDPEAEYKIAQAYAVLGGKTSALRALRHSVDSGFLYSLGPSTERPPKRSCVWTNSGKRSPMA